MNDTASRPDSRLRKAYAETPDDLLESQNKAIKLVLSGIGLALKRAAAAAVSLDYNDRPNQIYLIDGGRGAGKTFTMLTLEQAVTGLMVGGGKDSGARDDWKAKWEKHAALIHSPSGFRAEVLRIIFPGEFTEGEMLMEHVFAEILTRLTQAETDYGDPNSGKRDLVKQKRAGELKERLLKNVAQGWYFAKRFGFDAVVRDAINYEDLVLKWSEESSNASKRIDEWRKFVRDWLEFSGADLMVILLDDSDNDEILTENILHTMRLVLDHPQIVTVVAGNLNAMRETLLHLRMERLARSVSALRSGDAPSAKVWRRKLRREIEEYLEKVIPQQQRIYLTVARSGAMKSASADFEKIFERKSLKELVREALGNTRKPFLNAKFLRALRHEAHQSDAPDDQQRRNLEAYLSWWLFGNLYAAELQPRSVRNLHTFRDHYGPQIEGADRWKKRLLVVLYGFSGNFDLLQQLTDDDASVIAWLRQQSLGSIWTGRRALIINDREVPHLAYGNAYLRYRLDVGLGMPFRDNVEQLVPQELLPKPVGRRNLRRFFKPRQSPRRYRRLGLARWMDHAAIPSNCLYFHDLMALPDGAFIDLRNRSEKGQRQEIERLQSGHWESRLADDWLSTVEDDQETDADEYLARYFREVVCEALRGTRGIVSGDLLNLVDPPDLHEKQTRAIYEYFVDDEFRLFGLKNHERARLFKSPQGEKPCSPRTASNGFGETLWPENPDRMIALYMSLTSDLRRGWHAIRIHQVAPKVLGNLEGDESREVHSIVSTKDRLRLYRCDSIRFELNQNPWLKGVLAQLGKGALEKRFKDYFDSPERREVKTKRSFYFLQQFLKKVVAKVRDAGDDDDAKRYLVSMVLKALYHSGFHPSEPRRFKLKFSPPAECATEWAKVKSDTDIDVLLARSGADNWIKPIDDLQAELTRIEKANAKGRSAAFRDIAIAQARFRLYLRQIDISRVFEARDRLYQRPLVQEENYSFDVWMRTLRSMARFLCEDWPFHDNVLSPEAHPKLFKPLPVLNIRHWGAPASEAVEYGKDVSEDILASRENGRSARNFVLLMYGLAPCLPAMIHANVMSRVYEARLRLGSFDEREPLPRRKFTMAESLRLIRDAVDEIDRWAHLIGQLSVLLRIIKIKALHLDLRLLLEAFEKVVSDVDPDTQKANPKHAIDQNYRMFERAVKRSHRVPEALKDFSSGIGREMFETCREMMEIPKTPQSEGWHLITGLAIFPDISPSTLFGEGWIGDLVSRRAFVDRLRSKCGREEKSEKMDHDDNLLLNDEIFVTDRSNPDRPITESTLSVNGVFGETEQWLWACNRTLRKLRSAIVAHAVDPSINVDRPGSASPLQIDLQAFLEAWAEPSFTDDGEEKQPDREEQSKRDERLSRLANELIEAWFPNPAPEPAGP